MSEKSQSIENPPDFPHRKSSAFWLLIILGGLAGVVICGGGIFLAIWMFNFQHRDRFASVVVLYVEAPTPELNRVTKSMHRIPEPKEVLASIKSHCLDITSDSVLNEALNKDDIKQSRWFQSFSQPRSDAARKYLQNGALRAEQVPSMTQIRVTFEASGKYKDEMTTILNSLVLAYLNHVHEEAIQKKLQFRQAFNDELHRAEADLADIVKQLKRFQDECQLPSAQTTCHEYSMFCSRLAQSETDLKAVLAKTRDDLKARTEKSKNTTPSAPTAQEIAMAENAPSVQKLDEEIRNARAVLAELEERIDPGSTVIDQKIRIRALEDQHEQEIKHIIETYNAAVLARVRGEVADLEAQVDSVRKQLNDARAKLRDISTITEEYETIARRQAMIVAKRNKAVEMLNDIRIMENPHDAILVDFIQTATEPQLKHTP